MYFTLYILFSKTLNAYYIEYNGDDLKERLWKHLTYHKGYTVKAKDCIVLYTEKYLTINILI